ncbi:MAG: carboxypeptidase regulatory-like domain-containing protein [Actinobacteria bacterium]|nr:carboxypeptidase regulatory-like domain-containing protein [Actinomycetota bacterium]
MTHTARKTRLGVAATLTGLLLSGVVATSAAASPEFDPIPLDQQGAGPFIDDIPDDAPQVQPFIAGAPTTTTINADDSGVVTGFVTDESSDPVDGTAVDVVATSEDGEVYRGSDVTDAAGAYRVALSLPAGRYTVVATAGSVPSEPATIIREGSLDIKLSVPKTVSERTTTLTVRVLDNGVLAKARVTLFSKEPTERRRRQIGTATTVGGKAAFTVRPWNNPVYTAQVTRKGITGGATVTGQTSPRFAPATAPYRAPQPTNPDPLVSAPKGNGAKSVSRKIPRSVWRSMKGLTWSRGCTSRNRLRLIEVNYRGFDGYRHRGQMIVSRSIGHKMARAFKRLYNKKFPIRQMKPVDSFGKNQGGRPGANDYKSMAADNTSGFNCRYVVGRESQRVRSPHASGRSIDINPWENPYVITP